MATGCYRAGLVATLIVTTAGIAPSRAADAPSARLRMPDPLLSLRDMYPDIATGATGRAAVQAPRFPSATTATHGDRLDGPSAGRPELPMSNAWQRLGDYRAPGSLRLLTLWRATAGTVALHAGRHGGPSLQWTSPISGHGTNPSGLFDRLVATGGPTTR